MRTSCVVCCVSISCGGGGAEVENGERGSPVRRQATGGRGGGEHLQGPQGGGELPFTSHKLWRKVELWTDVLLMIESFCFLCLRSLMRRRSGRTKREKRSPSSHTYLFPHRKRWDTHTHTHVWGVCEARRSHAACQNQTDTKIPKPRDIAVTSSSSCCNG